MKKLVGLTSDYRQSHIVPIDGLDEKATLLLEFKPLLNCWFFTLTWGDVEVYNDQFVSAPNILREYSAKLPFGIMVNTRNSLDPLTLDTFVTGETEVFVMTSEEAAQLEGLLYG